MAKEINSHRQSDEKRRDRQKRNASEEAVAGVQVAVMAVVLSKEQPVINQNNHRDQGRQPIRTVSIKSQTAEYSRPEKVPERTGPQTFPKKIKQIHEHKRHHNAVKADSRKIHVPERYRQQETRDRANFPVK